MAAVSAANKMAIRSKRVQNIDCFDILGMETSCYSVPGSRFVDLVLPPSKTSLANAEIAIFDDTAVILDLADGKLQMRNGRTRWEAASRMAVVAACAKRSLRRECPATVKLGKGKVSSTVWAYYVYSCAQPVKEAPPPVCCAGTNR